MHPLTRSSYQPSEERTFHMWRNWAIRPGGVKKLTPLHMDDMQQSQDQGLSQLNARESLSSYTSTKMVLGKYSWPGEACLWKCLELHFVVQLGNKQMNKMDGRCEKSLLEKMSCMKNRAHMKKGEKWRQKMGRKSDNVRLGVHLFLINIFWFLHLDQVLTIPL